MKFNWKKTSLISLAITLLAVGSYFALKVFNSFKPQVKSSSDSKVSVFAENLAPLFQKPYKVKIDNIGLNTVVETVAAEKDGSLGTPKDVLSLGWFSDGALAGENGNLIIDGHYDTHTGAPAAFWNLKKVKVGDIVTVVDVLGRSFNYSVSEVFYLDINDPDRLRIFEQKLDRPYVTLITCGGVWSPSKQNYSQRLVVKGQFILGQDL